MAPGPWFYGPTQMNQGHEVQAQPDGGSPTVPGAGSSIGLGMFYAGRMSESDNPGSGLKPYPVPQLGFLPYPYLAASGRLEPNDPLYTTMANGPKLGLITQQLFGIDHYSS